MEMPLRGRRLLVAAALLVAAGLTTQFALGRKKDKPAGAMRRWTTQKRAVHALNRLTFGPRPGDVERVTQMGVDKWIELQLHPDKIDDSALDARLAPFRTLRMETKEIVENFPPEPVDQADRRRESLAAARSHQARGLRSATPALRRQAGTQRQEEAAKSATAQKRARRQLL